MKKEYQRFLNEKKKELLVSHFRYNRSFRPNELELELLRHKYKYIIPNYFHFKQEMDHPTQSIATYLENKFQYLLDPENSDLSEKFQELYEFGAKCFDKYYGERISSDTYVVKETGLASEENSINQVMIVLLMDEQRYGC